MIKIHVILNNVRWKKYFKDPKSYISNQLKKFNYKNKKFKKKNIYCSLLLSGEKEIKKLNFKFRNKNQTTDVLSFPFNNKKELKRKLKSTKEFYLGDIIVNLNKIRNKKRIDTFKLEFNKIWIHGLVHLFGYDHKKDKDFNKMQKIEKKFLSYLE